MSVSTLLADVVAETLAEAGVNRIFCVPGAHIDELCRSISAHPDIDLVVCRTEHGSGMMAIGHARISGQVACCLAIPGPGLLNLATALATAGATSVPFLCIAGAIDSRWDSAGLGLLHEVPPVLRHENFLSAWHSVIPRDFVADEIHTLLAATLTPPHRPALLEVAVDISAMDVTAQSDPVVRGTSDVSTPHVDATVSLLEGASRPLLVSGGGARGSGDAVLKLAEQLGAPVVATNNGRSAVLEADNRVFPATALGPLWEACDLVVAIGTRLASAHGSNPRLQSPRPVVRVDADPGRKTTAGPLEVALTGDAASVLQALINQKVNRRASNWDADDLAKLRDSCVHALGSVRPQAEYTRALDAALADEAVVALDSTQIGYHAMHGLPLAGGRTLLTAGRQGTLGSALPMALGAKLAAPSRQVVCIVGDGGFVASMAELATLIMEGLDVAVVVFNDGAYGEVLRASPHEEARQYSRLANPDFVLLAQSFGLPAQRVSSPYELEEVLRDDLASAKPLLVEVSIGPCPRMGPIFEVGSYGKSR